MRLFEAIVDANHRAAAGDASAGVSLEQFADALPVVALTCIDPRLNPLFPAALGLPAESFIWLRNAGNIITGPLSSTMRSLALACAVKGGREIAIIGHTDCLVGKTTMLKLTDRFRELGIDRAKLPENLNEYFGVFASERQNILKAVEHVRSSPLIGPRVPVHGLLADIQSGRLEWLVNGYQVLDTATSSGPVPKPGPLVSPGMAAFQMGEMKFPEGKIGGDTAANQTWSTEPAPTTLAQSTAPKPTWPAPAAAPTKQKYEPRQKTIPMPRPLSDGRKPPKLG